ncbi:hypothetical protein CC78DRAFT_534648 [Lojkania enalia]|uniref:Uncharacterized protein n=1 Tax=Lojkania enalia TaxID=147567 RepID=A0A9P4K7A5_9PLEO|nr:hypothetical protein CC78DRAFT_534648 [Didymosphaeria enalia]
MAAIVRETRLPNAVPTDLVSADLLAQSFPPLHLCGVCKNSSLGNEDTYIWGPFTIPPPKILFILYISNSLPHLPLLHSTLNSAHY